MATRDFKYLSARLRERATKGAPLSEDDERYLAAVKDFTLMSDLDTAAALDAIARARRAAGQWAARQAKGTNASVIAKAERTAQWHGVAEDHMRRLLSARESARSRLDDIDVPKLADKIIARCEASGIYCPKPRSVRAYISHLLATDPADW